jgi:ribosomal protein S19E (S16A)
MNLGRLKGINQQEILIEDAAWIPETERWADFVSTGAHKEAEPYTKPVVLNRGAMLDITEIPSLITKQR